MFEVTTQTWTASAKLSSVLRRRGITLPLSDILISTVATEHNLTIMTVDTHFKHIPNLSLIML